MNGRRLSAAGIVGEQSKLDLTLDLRILSNMR